MWKEVGGRAPSTGALAGSPATTPRKSKAVSRTQLTRKCGATGHPAQELASSPLCCAELLASYTIAVYLVGLLGFLCCRWAISDSQLKLFSDFVPVCS